MDYAEGTISLIISVGLTQLNKAGLSKFQITTLE